MLANVIMQAQFWAPAAAAAGVSLVMAYLNGVAIPNLLSVQTLIAKWVGTCCSVGANLALGPEAPMVMGSKNLIPRVFCAFNECRDHIYARQCMRGTMKLLCPAL